MKKLKLNELYIIKDKLVGSVFVLWAFLIFLNMDILNKTEQILCLLALGAGFIFPDIKIEINLSKSENKENE